METHLDCIFKILSSQKTIRTEFQPTDKNLTPITFPTGLRQPLHAQIYLCDYTKVNWLAIKKTRFSVPNITLYVNNDFRTTPTRYTRD